MHPSPSQDRKLAQTRRGWFITVEGIDGAGKSSHIEAMAGALRGAGAEVLLTREPGGTPLAEQIRALLLHESMDAVAETLLAFAARRHHLQQVIVPALAAGTTVLCDRFTDATFAYQGAGRGVAWPMLEQLEAWVQGADTREAGEGQTAVPPWHAVVPPGGCLQPDCTLWFDVPPAVAAERLQQARTPDRFEAEARSFFERVAAGYARRAQQAPQRFVRIDAGAERAQVGAQVLEALRARGYLAPHGLPGH
ncbi:dTMP kinase [Corticibacter populi]|uniref:Thymidylate kinase n=1 Tax=Corticibacter populi TaxID=1550736 RepID=A0A3M6QZT9_9BURK|nr:dTMP kinase [Corticibacter populi]RMX08471.1 dTMP kinase [Corticibacter populi]RZS35784.1 thymidylate kinase [Corticibacter populi]